MFKILEWTAECSNKRLPWVKIATISFSLSHTRTPRWAISFKSEITNRFESCWKWYVHFKIFIPLLMKTPAYKCFKLLIFQASENKKSISKHSSRPLIKTPAHKFFNFFPSPPNIFITLSIWHFFMFHSKWQYILHATTSYKINIQHYWIDTQRSKRLWLPEAIRYRDNTYTIVYHATSKVCDQIKANVLDGQFRPYRKHWMASNLRQMLKYRTKNKRQKWDMMVVVVWLITEF